MSVNGEIPIGPRLRMARQQGGLSIGQVAAETGLTKGFISQVERDLTSASVAALVRLCDALHISVASLFEPTSANLVRYDSRSRINFGGDNVTEWLLTPTTERRIRVIESRIAPGGGSGPEAYVLGAEAEWAHVVQGTLEIRVGDQDHLLQTGDSLTFSAREPRSWRNPSKSEPTTVLWVLCPAGF